MAWNDLLANQMVSFTDAQGGGFTLLPGQSNVSSNQCMTKNNILTKYNIASDNFNTYANDQLVPKNVWPSDIIIDTQIWTNRNLDVETYRDGTLIPQATTNADWLSKTYNGIGAWCYYDNDPVNGATYGKLYNWGAVNNTANGGLAPLGYHVPTYAEFDVLVTFLGANSSGFASLQKGGGYRHLDDGSFNGINAGGNWWSSTEFNSYLVWTMFNQSTEDLSLSTWYKQGGMSVRLIKDS
jgi:hypothetical protein